MDHTFLNIHLHGQERRATIVNVTSDTNIESLADQIYTEHPQHLTYSDIVIARFISQKALTRTKNALIKTLKPLIERAPKASIHALTADDYEFRCTSNLNPRLAFSATDSASSTELIHELCHAEMNDFLIRSSAVFKASDRFVFRSPSHQYCSAFLRIGNIQMGRFQIDAIFFWLLPYLKDKGVIVTDTWSISSISLNTARLLQIYDPKRVPLDVQMLAHYYDGSPAIQRETEKLLRDATLNGSRKALCLISIVMTGKSLENLQKSVSTAGIPDTVVSYVAIYQRGKGIKIPALCDLSSGIDDVDFQSWSSPPKGRVVVEIDPYTYFPQQLEETVFEVSKKPICKEVSKFFDKYQGHEVISVHRDSLDSNKQKIRHHGIDVDVLNMLKVDEFKASLRATLETINPAPALIIAPPHEAGAALLRFVCDFFEAKFRTMPTVLVHADLDKNDSSVPVELIKSLGTDDMLLILDDVTTTGIRLSRFQAHLRDSNLSYRGRIFYLIGVARPSSEKAWDKRQRDLRFRNGYQGQHEKQHAVVAIEKMILPDWDERDCPWCQEEDAIDALAKCIPSQTDAELRGVLITRLRELVNARNGAGLIKNAIWRIGTGTAPKITDNSIFIRNRCPSDADVVAAVSAVFHYWRKTIPLGVVSYPHVTIVDHCDYLGTTFNDVILKVAILRACAKKELVHWKDDLEHAKYELAKPLMLGHSVDLDDVDSLRLEFGIATIAGKLPNVFDEDSGLNELGESVTERFLRLLAERG